MLSSKIKYIKDLFVFMFCFISIGNAFPGMTEKQCINWIKINFSEENIYKEIKEVKNPNSITGKSNIFIVIVKNNENQEIISEILTNSKIVAASTFMIYDFANKDSFVGLLKKYNSFEIADDLNRATKETLDDLGSGVKIGEYTLLEFVSFYGKKYDYMLTIKKLGNSGYKSDLSVLPKKKLL